VKKAAEFIGVGRPALSNLLNGNAALTPEMAMRIEKTFGANAQELLALQTAYDEFQPRWWMMSNGCPKMRRGGRDV